MVAVRFSHSLPQSIENSLKLSLPVSCRKSFRKYQFFKEVLSLLEAMAGGGPKIVLQEITFQGQVRQFLGRARHLGQARGLSAASRISQGAERCGHMTNIHVIHMRSPNTKMIGEGGAGGGGSKNCSLGNYPYFQ